MIQISEDIVLRPISFDAVGDIFQTTDKERAYLREWLPFVDSTRSEEDTRAFVSSVIEKEEIAYVIYEQSRFVGLIGFNNYDYPNKKVEIGYWLSENSQGKGIITRSVLKLLEKAFFELDFNSVRINVAVDNHKSRKIPEKLGFFQEGITRDGELLVDNKFTDIVVYSMLKKEFNKES